jgi:hypothetical protein
MELEVPWDSELSMWGFAPRFASLPAIRPARRDSPPANGAVDGADFTSTR